MGFGDQLIGLGIAKPQIAKGKRIAFGDGRRILWDHHSKQIFNNNPNVVWPHEDLKAGNVTWLPFYKGRRHYNRPHPDRWEWNYDFHVEPGEFFLTDAERAAPDRLGLPKRFIVIEPHTKTDLAPYLVNKRWPFARYQEVVNALRSDRLHVVQFIYGNMPRLKGAWQIETPSFRSAVPILGRAALYLGAEGGTHHAAAALNVPGVVIFGGWLPPSVLGYAAHTNLTGGATEFCGLFRPCEHCARALDNISVDEVIASAKSLLGGGHA